LSRFSACRSKIDLDLIGEGKEGIDAADDLVLF